MINLKLLLQKLLQRYNKIGMTAPDISLYNKIYPIGAVVTTASAVNPSNTYGGTWTLIHKDLKNASYSATTASNSYITLNTTYATFVQAYIRTYPDHIMVRINFKNKSAVDDTTYTIATINGPAIGLNAFFSASGAYVITGDATQANGPVVGLGRVTASGSNAVLNVYDWIPALTTSYPTGTNRSMWLTVNIPFKYTDVLDSFTETFYWKRTA